MEGLERVSPEGLTLKKWLRIDNLLALTGRKVTAWLTSTEWALLAKDVGSIATDQGITTPLTHANFGEEVKLGPALILRNSGTEDQGTVNAMNWVTFGDQFPQFDYNRRTLQTGNGFSTHDLNLKDDPLNE